MSAGDWIALGGLAVTVLIAFAGGIWAIFNRWGQFEVAITTRLAVIELRLDGLDKDAAQARVSRLEVYRRRGRTP